MHAVCRTAVSLGTSGVCWAQPPQQFHTDGYTGLQFKAEGQEATLATNVAAAQPLLTEFPNSPMLTKPEMKSKVLYYHI